MRQVRLTALVGEALACFGYVKIDVLRLQAPEVVLRKKMLR
jgi:hypothetical protein